MQRIEQLVDEAEPAIELVREWLRAASVDVEVLPPSAARAEVLLGLQITTRSPLGALAYETGGLLLDGGWVRFLGSGHPRFTRDLLHWNEGRSHEFSLVADDAVGGFFAINGGAFGPDIQQIYYWAPDRLDWEPLELGFTSLLRGFLEGRIAKFYEGLRWPSWRGDVAALSPDHCFTFYPFLWMVEGSLQRSHRGVVPVTEAFDMKASIVQQLGDGA